MGTRVLGLIGRPCEAPDDLEPLWRAGPVLIEQLRAAAAQDESQGQSDQDRVVKLAGDGDEVRDQVDRQHQVAEHQDKRQLADSRHAIVDEESPEEDETIGNEAHHRSRLAASAQDDQGQYDARVESQECSKGDDG